MARKKMFVSHAKAEKELGYAPGSVEVALERAIHWFRESGRA
jgi:dihydroflavonol-4-reductase